MCNIVILTDLPKMVQNIEKLNNLKTLRRLLFLEQLYNLYYEALYGLETGCFRSF